MAKAVTPVAVGVAMAPKYQSYVPGLVEPAELYVMLFPVHTVLLEVENVADIGACVKNGCINKEMSKVHELVLPMLYHALVLHFSQAKDGIV